MRESLLSNEIHYRVSRLRTLKDPGLPSGHFHLPEIQTQEKPLFNKTLTARIVREVRDGIRRAVNAPG